MRICHQIDPYRDEGEVTLARYRVRVRVRSTIRDWFSGVERPRGYWQVFGTREEPCERGEDIADGRVIRLLHVQTRKWLHSHAAHRSPLTNNQEVSAHGDDENSDAGDEWKFEVADGNKGDKAGPVWKKDQKVRLQHRQTKAFLSCSNTKFQRRSSGKTKCAGRAGRMRIACGKPIKACISRK